MARFGSADMPGRCRLLEVNRKTFAHREPFRSWGHDPLPTWAASDFRTATWAANPVSPITVSWFDLPNCML